MREPVVTCDDDRLRFESFSARLRVYTRLDVLSESLDGEVHDRGTTNMDIKEPLRRMLSRVGSDELAVERRPGSCGRCRAARGPA